MDQDERNALSRRRVVGGLGIGMAVAAAGPAQAQEKISATQRPQQRAEHG